jgi:hypothetical protein
MNWHWNWGRALPLFETGGGISNSSEWETAVGNTYLGSHRQPTVPRSLTIFAASSGEYSFPSKK